MRAKQLQQSRNRRRCCPPPAPSLCQKHFILRIQAPHSARKDKKSTSSAPRVSSARLSSRRSWVGSEEALDTAQCASSLITKPITIKATPSSKPTKFRDPVGAQQVAFASHTTPISETEGEPSEDNIEDQQRKSRIHLWYQRLLHFRANPNSLEFSYLVLADPAATKYYPYDLIIVKHDQLVARDTSFFYTMSADGVTQTHGKEVTHMSLDEFERGYTFALHSSTSFLLVQCSVLNVQEPNSCAIVYPFSSLTS